MTWRFWDWSRTRQIVNLWLVLFGVCVAGALLADVPAAVSATQPSWLSKIALALAPHAVEIVAVFVVPFVGAAVTKWLKARASADHLSMISQAAAVAYWVAEQVERKAPDGTTVDKLAHALKLVAEQMGRDLKPGDMIKAEAALKALHEERRSGSLLLVNKQIAQ